MKQYGSPPRRWRQSVVACLGVVLITAPIAFGVTWDNESGDNDWDTAINWNPDGVPTSGTVYINDIDDETDDDYCNLFSSKNISGLFLGISDQPGAKLNFGALGAGINSVLNVDYTLLMGASRRQCDLVVSAWGTLNACVSGGDVSIGYGVAGSYVADEWSTLTVQSKGDFNCYSDLYLSRVNIGTDPEVDYRSQAYLRIESGGELTVDPVTKANGIGAFYFASDEKSYAEADIYGSLTCHSTTTNGVCTLQVGCDSITGDTAQALLWIHRGGLVQVDDLEVTSNGRIVLSDTGTLAVKADAGNWESVQSELYGLRNDGIITANKYYSELGSNHMTTRSVRCKYDSTAGYVYVFVSCLWTNENNNHVWDDTHAPTVPNNDDNWYKGVYPNWDYYVHINLDGTYEYCSLTEDDTAYGLRLDGGEVPGAKLIVDDAVLTIRYYLMTGSYGHDCELRITNDGVVNANNSIWLGSGDYGEYDENAESVTIVENGGELVTNASITLGSYANAYLEIDSSSQVIVNSNGDGDSGLWVAVGEDSYASADVYGSLIVRGPMAMGHKKYSEFDPEKLHASIAIHDGATVEATDLTMCTYMPTAQIELDGSGELILHSSAGELEALEEKIEVYINEGWITANSNLVTVSTVGNDITISANGHGQKAHDPYPRDGEFGLSADSGITLSWVAGNDAVRHVVYLGTETFDLFQEQDGSATTMTRQLTPDTYYWRVDEYDASNNLIATGDVWSFTVCSYLASGYNIWTAPSTQRVFMESRPEAFADLTDSTVEYAVRSAQNEYESFQLVILPEPGTNVNKIQLEFDPIIDGEGREIEFDWYRVGYVWLNDYWVDGKTDHIVDKDVAGPGWWPDLLLPVSEDSGPGDQYYGFDITEWYAQPLWITMYVPSDFESDTYSGTVKIHSCNDVSSNGVVEVDFAIQVDDFELPDGPGSCRTMFDLRTGAYDVNPDPDIWEGEGGFDISSGELDMAFMSMLKHRFNPNTLYRRARNMYVSGVGYWFPTDTTLNAYYAGGMNALNIGHYDSNGTEGARNYCTMLDANAGVADTAYSFYGDESNYWQSWWKNRHHSRAWNAAHYPNVTQVTCDHNYLFWELDRDSYQSWWEDTNDNGICDGDDPAINAYANGLTTTEGNRANDLYRYYIDEIVSGIGFYDKAEARVLRQQGFKVSTYPAGWESANYPSFVVNMPLSECRTMYWQMFNQEIDAYLYYKTEYCTMTRNRIDVDPDDTTGEYEPDSPYNPTSNGPCVDLNWDGRYANYGEAQLFFPAMDNDSIDSNGAVVDPIDPVVSLRLSVMRDGIEDYLYLKMLQEKAGSFERANLIASDVFDITQGGEIQIEHDISELDARRQTVANAILGMDSPAFTDSVYNENDDAWYGTIAAAIDASSNGDVLVVQPGTYTESVDLTEKALTIRSVDPDDPSQVILDGENEHQIVLCTHSPTTASVLDGLTLQNGSVGVSEEGLVVHWKLDDGSGAVAVDESENENDADLLDDDNTFVTSWCIGTNGGALDFDGTDDWLVSSDTVQLSGEFTYSFWVNPAVLGSANIALISMSDTSDMRHTLVYSYNLLYLQVEYVGANGGLFSNYSVLSTDEWQHVVVVYSDANSICKIYVDGVDETQYSWVGDGTFNDTADEIAVGYTLNGNDAFYEGMMDDIRVYDRALSELEIERLYHSSPYTSGGAVYCDSSKLKMRNCVVQDSFAQHGGGGVFAIDSSVAIERCVINSNGASFGGGVMLSGCDVTDFDQNWFEGNSSAVGSGLYLANCFTDIRLTNSLFADNYSVDDATIYAIPDEDAANVYDLEIVGCTLADNVSSNGTAGVLLDVTDDWRFETFINSCIFWGNVGSSDPIVSNYPIYPYSVTVDYSCIQGGWANEGDYNTSSDPLFGDDYTPSSTLCINGGDPDWGHYRNGLSNYGGEDYSDLDLHVNERFDVDGDKRVNYINPEYSRDFRFDMGAQEYVDTDCSAYGD